MNKYRDLKYLQTEYCVALDGDFCIRYFTFIWISHSERIISYSFMYTAVPASLTVLSDNRLFFFKSSVISPNKQSQNANKVKTQTYVEFLLKFNLVC